MRRRIRQLELALAGVFLMGPMVYALTLSAPAPQVCPEVVAAVQQTCEVEPAVEAPLVEPAPVVEPTPIVEPEVEPAPLDPHAFTLREFAFVEGDRIVLSDEAKASWGHGDLFEPAGGAAEHRAAKLADLERIPSGQLAQLGRRFDLYGREGKVCSVEIERLLVVAQYGWGYEGLFPDEAWNEETGEPREFPAARTRRALWAKQPRWLVGEFTAEGCEGALWARDAALPAPVVLRHDDAPSELSKARQAAFRKSDELAEAKSYYEEYTADSSEDLYPSWKKLLRDNPIEVATWFDPRGEARFVELHFGPEHTECGDPTPDIDLLDEVREGEFVATERSATPSSIVDVDLDGSFEFLYVTSGAEYSGWLDFAEGDDRHATIDADFYCPC